MTEEAVGQIERILAEIEDADEVLRATVVALVEDPSIAWAGIGFLDDGQLTRGPQAGRPDETRTLRVSVAYQGAVVGVLDVDGDPDRARLERVATLIAPHVLIGWDTGGEAWEP